MSSRSRILTTPNEVYWFAEKRQCIACGCELTVDKNCYGAGVSDTKFQKWYMTFITCLECDYGYDLEVRWSDPKNISINEEWIRVDSNDHNCLVVRYLIGKAAELIVDGDNITVPYDWFDFDHFSVEDFAQKINAILLLK